MDGQVRGADALLMALETLGVRYIFGLPGDTSVGFYRALVKSRTIRHIMMRDERGAGYAADAYARFSGKIGVVEAPSGAGALYLMPAVAEAHESRVPLLAITTETEFKLRGHGVLTELDQVSVFEPITKLSVRVTSPESISWWIERAIHLACASRPGAVHIAVPKDVLEERIEVSKGHSNHLEPQCPLYRPLPDLDEIDKAINALLKAQRPIIVAGGGVIRSGAWDALVEFAEALHIPVATTISGKGAIETTHPLHVGVVGENGALDVSNSTLEQADLVFFIGCKTGSVATSHWSNPKPGEKRIIHLDIDPDVVGRNYPEAIKLVGDAKATLEAFIDIVEDEDLTRAPWFSGIELPEYKPRREPPFSGRDIIEAINSLVDDEFVVVADAGTPTPFAAAFLSIRKRGRKLVIPRGFGGLGYALGASVGAAFATQLPVLALVTDGSFGMAAGELESIARLQLPITIVLCDNSMFGWIEKLEMDKLGSRFSVEFNKIEYDEIAQGFGLNAYKVSSLDELRRAIDESVRSGAPSLIWVPILPESKDKPPVPGWHSEKD